MRKKIWVLLDIYLPAINTSAKPQHNLSMLASVSFSLNCMFKNNKGSDFIENRQELLCSPLACWEFQQGNRFCLLGGTLLKCRATKTAAP